MHAYVAERTGDSGFGPEHNVYDKKRNTTLAPSKIVLYSSKGDLEAE